MPRGKIIKKDNGYFIDNPPHCNFIPFSFPEWIMEKNETVEFRFNNSKEVEWFNFKNKRYYNRNAVSGHQSSSTTNENNKAFAPYNFVPLNETVIECKRTDHDQFSGNSGYIDLAIEVKTPLFIRGNNAEFLKINECPIIPGSSLRGMIRNLVEITSWSRIDVDDESRQNKMFWRNLGDRDYRSNFSKGAKKSLVQCGWLEKKGENYFLRPAIKLLGHSFFRVNGEFPIDENNEKNESIDEYWKKIRKEKIFIPSLQHNEIEVYGKELKKVYFKTSVDNIQTFYNKKEKSDFREIHYNIIKDYQFSAPHQGAKYSSGYIVATGYINRKHFQWLIAEMDESATKIQVTEQVNALLNDKNASDETSFKSLVDKFENKLMPCFYIEQRKKNKEGKETKTIQVGGTGFFRLPYDKTLEDMILPEHKIDQVDISTSIFGSTDQAGKVFFEDGTLKNPPKDGTVFKDYESTGTPQILGSPKITTFQHYLEKKPGEGGEVSWNGTGVIRGFKQYWNKSASGWIKYDDEETKQLNSTDKGKEELKKYPKPIQPISPKTMFKAKVRFENLSKEELGCLLFVLDLPKKSTTEYGCHKLGMGKPLGLGSVKIRPTLTTIKRKERYQSLFDEKNGWALGKSIENEIDSLKMDFENWLLKKLKEENPQDFKHVTRVWDIPRLKELKAMLTYHDDRVTGKDKSKWSQATRYMEIEPKDENGNKKKDEDGKPLKNEYLKRPVLPKPSHVIENFNKK